MADEATVTSCVKDLRNLLTETSLVEKKSFVRNIIKEIKVTGDYVLVTYTMPLLQKGLVEEKIPVLCIVHDGGRFWIRTRVSSLMKYVFHI
ncbi:MAG: hypothetical protein JW967_10875 [Dehalococcoidales bacterium]|nr:hypothetical protein [Dehalococcoidales bacterium]